MKISRNNLAMGISISLLLVLIGAWLGWDKSRSGLYVKISDGPTWDAGYSHVEFREGLTLGQTVEEMKNYWNLRKGDRFRLSRYELWSIDRAAVNLSGILDRLLGFDNSAGVPGPINEWVYENWHPNTERTVVLMDEPPMSLEIKPGDWVQLIRAQGTADDYPGPRDPRVL